MSDPAFEQPPILPTEEVVNAYEAITALDSQLAQLETNRAGLLKDIRDRIKTSAIPQEARMIALALQARNVAKRYEYLRSVDELIKTHSGGIAARVCYEGITSTKQGTERIALVLTLGRLPSVASLEIDERGEAAVPFESAVKILMESPSPPRKKGHGLFDLFAYDILGYPEWEDYYLSETIAESGKSHVSLSDRSKFDFMAGQTNIRQSLLDHLNPRYPNGTTLDSAFNRLMSA